MEIERQTEVRLSQWLCEAIEDTIKRYQWVIKYDGEEVARNRETARQEREKQQDPIVGRYQNPEMYEGFVEKGEQHIARGKKATDELLDLLKSANAVRDKAIEFWLWRVGMIMLHRALHTAPGFFFVVPK